MSLLEPSGRGEETVCLHALASACCCCFLCSTKLMLSFLPDASAQDPCVSTGETRFARKTPGGEHYDRNVIHKGVDCICRVMRQQCLNSGAHKTLVPVIMATPAAAVSCCELA